MRKEERTLAKVEEKRKELYDQRVADGSWPKDDEGELIEYEPLVVTGCWDHVVALMGVEKSLVTEFQKDAAFANMAMKTHLGNIRLKVVVIIKLVAFTALDG